MNKYQFLHIYHYLQELQLYQMEKTEKGTGLACYTENLITMEAYFLSFLKSAGLESPFAPGRLEEVRKTLEAVLG